METNTLGSSIRNNTYYRTNNSQQNSKISTSGHKIYVSKYNPYLTTTNNNTARTTSCPSQTQNTGKSWGLRALAIVGIGLAAFVLTRGKVKTKAVTQVAEHLNFKPAKTMEEAVTFAKKNFDVTYHKSINDLNVMNFVNEWMTGLKNKGDLSKPYFKIVTNAQIGRMSHVASTFQGKKVLGINMALYKDASTKFEKCLGNSHGIFAKDKTGKFVIVAPEYDTEFVRNLVKRVNEYKPGKTTFQETERIYSDLASLSAADKFVNGKIQVERFSKFNVLDHELGHCRHEANVGEKFFDQLKKPSEYKNGNVSDLSKEFVNNAEIQKIAEKVSYYAPTSPAEFVAETYARMKSGKKFDEDVMNLYRKYGGPEIMA